MVMKARDLMTRQVATLSLLTDIETAARFMTERKITGVPVVDQHGNLIGVVSQTDLVRFQGRQLEGWPGGGGGSFGKDAERTPLFALMTNKPVTCEEDTPLEEVASVMLERRIHRVLVVKDGKLTGIITAMDLLRAVAARRKT